VKKSVASGVSRTAEVFERPVFARARGLCLQLPESTEKISWGHPNFRAGRKMFCAFEIVRGRPSIAFRLPPADVEALLQRNGDHSSGKVQKAEAAAQRAGRFFATPYGRGSWVSMWVDGMVNWKLTATLVESSYRTVATRRLIKLLDNSR
jgi:predicted DNA-binding protein (MmcQ/YjbR family)